MKTKDISVGYQFVTSGAINADFASSVVDLGPVKKSAVSVECVAAGSTPTGTFKLQGSVSGSNFADIASATAAITADSTSVINVTALAGMRYIKLVYTRTSGGTATGLNAYIRAVE